MLTGTRKAKQLPVLDRAERVAIADESRAIMLALYGQRPCARLSLAMRKLRRFNFNVMDRGAR